MKTWKVSNIETAEYLGILELENGNYFEILRTKTRLVFGNCCNIGLLESGYMVFDKDFTTDENLTKLLEELEVYYRDGKQYCSRIVCNDRM